ncbi:glycosyltransferase family protein [Serratia quinivorans]|uniref:hypothetical protein n=1 Tax=Serratia quinivorans TaxID=137545 RepID=UPI0021BD661A|nr:hypothetical protein [Serratia quinivorans]
MLAVLNKVGCEMKIAYYPENTGTNDYSNRFKHILSQFGEVEGVSFKSIVKRFTKFKFHRYDVIFINWLDSGIIDNQGKVRNSLMVKAILKIILFKIVAKKVIYVRHNLYPHGTQIEDSSRAKRYADFLMKISGMSVVHSPVAATVDMHYIPHPLYKTDNEFIQGELLSDDKKDSFVFFGRINKYKKLEELITKFPLDKKLIIAGSYDDESYVEKLKSISSDNISILAGYIDDVTAEKLISSSQGLIICHADPDMIVSGSFFYALSVKSRIICVETDFLRWANNIFGDNVVVCFKDIDDLRDKISSLPPVKEFDHDVVKLIKDNFGQVVITEKIKSLI